MISNGNHQASSYGQSVVTATAGQDSAQSTSGKRKRPYGLSCLACREKKMSCDGTRPKCAGCLHSGEDCHVPPPQRVLRRIHGNSSAQAAARRASTVADPHGSPASTASVQYLLERLRRTEERMKQLEQTLAVDLGPLAPLQSASPEELKLMHNEATSNQVEAWKDDGDALQQIAEGSGTDDGGQTASPDGSVPRYQLTLDESGNVVYHGLTGWSQGPQYVSPSAPSTVPALAAPGLADPTFAPFFQALASHKHISVAPDLGDALLECFFSYQIFETIHQPIFLRDMALNGPFFSSFLLMAIYAAATRKIDGLSMHDRSAQGELFMKLAKQYLAKDLERRPTIPLIQGLLLLSSTQLAEGDISGGWLHAGMAFTMIIDLGIHLSPETVVGAGQIPAEELAVRDRLFWSAFIWDKSMSLALGREPSFAPRLGRNPSSVQDFDDEQESWVPYFRDANNRPWNLATYVYHRKQRAAWFRFLARLCLILHDVIIDMYSTESRLSPRQRAGFVQRTRVRLEDLWKDIPDAADFDPTHPSPPPNVFMSRMLFHATNILLYRPNVKMHEVAQSADKGFVALCAEHSAKANQMAMSFTATFGERMTYVAQYSLFVAASFDIILLGAQPTEVQSAALGRLQLWMGMMDKSSSRVPSIRRSVQYITSSVCDTVMRNPVLASTEAGQWILMHHPDQQPQQFTPTTAAMMSIPQVPAETGVFDFFELLEPFQN